MAVRWTPKVSEGKDGEAEQMREAGKEALLPLCKGPEMNSQAPLTSEGCPDPATADLAL